MSREAEELRVKAEKGRVAAEESRAHAESNEGTGRVEAEGERREAEAQRQYDHEVLTAAAERSKAQFEHELEALREDPGHYMTPGARVYFRRVRNGYIVLALACIMGIWAVSNRADNRLREDINTVARAQCLGSIPTLKRYNSLVDIMIESNRSAREIALAEGDVKRVKLNTQNIIKLQDAHLRVPNAKECDAPILK